jgi:CubicO group peptidase (beta-lactamase class C family)
MTKTAQTALMLIVLAIGLLVSAGLGVWKYMKDTPPLHPNPKDVPTVTESTPLPQWSDAVAQAKQIALAALTEQSLPGLSVAVGTGGEIVWAEAFGWADIENHIPVTPHTRFRVGTASTALTSVAAGLLIEKGQLRLDDKIQTYVPEFPEKQWPVTLRQLMAHTAGIKSDGGDEGPLFSQHCERPVEGLDPFSKSSLLFEPGTKYRYSNYGWILVSAAVEAAAGEPLLAFMHKQVFKPLQMDETIVDSAKERVEHSATFYFPRFAANPRYGLHLMRQIDYSCYSGSSIFLSTPSDLVRFAMAINSGKLLQPATVQLLQTSQRLASGEETGYGLGWDLATATLAGKQTSLVGHDGQTLGGMVASFMTFPEHRITVSVTSNISYADTFSTAVKIAQAFAQGKGPANK